MKKISNSKINLQLFSQHSGYFGQSATLTPAGYNRSVNPGNGSTFTIAIEPALTSQYG